MKFKTFLAGCLGGLLSLNSCTNSPDMTDYAAYVNPFIGTGGHGHTFPGAIVPHGMISPSPDTRIDGWDACSGYYYADSTINGFSHTHLSGTGCCDYGDVLLMPTVGEQKYLPTGSQSQQMAYASAFSHQNETAEPGYYSVFLDTYQVKAELTASKRAAIHRYTFPETKDEQVFVKVGISAVDIEGARKNVETEIPDWDFDGVRKDARKAWNETLSKIDITTNDKDDETIFYTALYHTAISPNLFTDVDGRYLGMDLQVHQGDTLNPMYTIFSLWDTFRALHPLMTIIDPDLNNAFIRSLIKKHQEGGIFPMWDMASNYTGTMIGYHAVPVIVDAYMKGDRNFDIQEAYRACVRAAEYDTTGIKCPDLVLPHLMPKAKYYKNSIGYVPCDRENESVAKALEYAYDDWCISVFADALNDYDTRDKYARFAKAYEFYFDPETRFMRGLDSKGEWRTPFNPRSSTHRNDDYCEGTAWQWTWFVPHDIEGLVKLMGGEDAFVGKLDSLFTADSSLEGETTSSDISGLIGQYAHGNEPSHHVIHMYNYVNRPWRTQELVDSVYRSQYANAVDGLSGNEDCGQMSAWYVLNSMGFYQVCPGKPVYSIGRPAFDKAVVNLPDGKKFTVIAKNNSKKNKYIKSMTLNGKPLDKPFFTHDDIIAGSTLEIEMTDRRTQP